MLVLSTYMLISLITDTRPDPLMDDIFGTTTRFKISDPVGFGEWFVKYEDIRMKTSMKKMKMVKYFLWKRKHL